MLRTVLLVGLAALAPLLPLQDTEAPAATEKHNLSPHWSVGDSYRLELTKTRKRSQGGREGQEMGTVTPVEVLVHAEHEAGYSMRWTMGESEFIGMDPERAGLAAELVNMFQGVVLDMRTDEFGTPNALINEDDVRGHVEQLFDKIEELALAEGAPPAQLEQMLGPARSMLEGEMLDRSVLREPALYYFACGMHLEVGQLLEFEELLPNPFGGDPFPGNSQLLLESWDVEQNRAVLIHRLELDPEETSRVMLETFTQLAKKMGGPAPEAEDLPEFEIVDESEYDIDLATGLPRSMSHVRTASTAGTTQVDRIAIRVLPASEEE